jgi:hypothetical protein
MSDNIKVMVRIRPINSREMTEGGRTCVGVNEGDAKSISLDGNPKPRNFAYDWSGGSNTSQQEVFNFIGRQMVDTCLGGIHLLTQATIVPYLHTGRLELEKHILC